MRTVPLAGASNAFGFELWSRLRSTPGNLAISPASLSAGLAMTWAGARGETAAEMQRVLKIEEDAGSASAGWGKLAAGLQDEERSFQLRMAIRLFGDQSLQIDPAYLERIRAAYTVPLKTADFAGAPEVWRARINEWIEGQTEQRIRELLPPGAITTETRLVLANAISFLADWMDPFNKDNTTEQPFKLTGGETRPVMMMCRRGDYRLAKNEGVAVLALPYADGDATMVVALPTRPDGLEAVERTLTAGRLAAWMQALTHAEVLVWLPRFLVEAAEPARLSGPLQALGMARAFDRERADLGGIASPPSPADRLVINEVFHKAYVKVDEQGTEAAASTVVEMMRVGGMPQPVPEFRADRPFLFFILDEATGLVLFMGRVADPKAP